MNPKDKTCFVIRPIGDPESNVRKHADDRYEHLIKSVCESCGYSEILHAGEISIPGVITIDIVDRIINSSLVVADLSGSNPNVFYELSLRHALRKPYVCIASRDETLPFDTHDCRTVFYGSSTAFAEYDKVKQELKEAILGAEKIGSDIESPISISIDILQLGRGGALERAASATLRNTETIISMLGDVDRPIGFKIYEAVEKLRRGFECISEEFVFCAQRESQLDGKLVLDWLRRLESYMRDAPKIVCDELRGIVVANLRELAQERR